MTRFLSKLFGARKATAVRHTTAPAARPRTTRLSVDAMEDRFCPAGVTNPGVIRGFNPQPDPPAVTRAIIAINPGEARGFNPQPDPPAEIPGTGGWVPVATARN